MTAVLHWSAPWRCHSEVFRWPDVSAAAAAGSRSPFYPEALAFAALGAAYRGDRCGTACRGEQGARLGTGRGGGHRKEGADVESTFSDAARQLPAAPAPAISTRPT